MKQSRSFKPLRSSLSMGVLAFGGLASSLACAEPAALAPTQTVAGKPSATDGQAKQPAAPNILIIMLDDAGFAQADTVGGEIHTPTLSRISQSGIKYNAFHTTADR